MQYGLMVYERRDNLGNDIWSYAASRFYPHIDYYIDCDKVDSFFSFNGEQVAAIMAGYYTHNPLDWPPSPYIYPLMVGMHFTENMRLQIGNANVNMLGSKISKSWFELSGPDGVGCRDYHTVNALKEIGINAWFSGCISLTLEPFEDVESGGEGSVVLVDISPEAEAVLRKHISGEVISMTHYQYGQKNMEERMKEAEERLRFYQSCRLVITTRLHAALPSLALGVPVLLVIAKNTDYRFEPYREYLHCIREEDIINDTFSYPFEEPIRKGEELIEVGKELAAICREFIVRCEAVEEVPHIQFAEFFDGVRRANWLKSLIYQASDNWYLQNYSDHRENPYIVYQEGMEAYERNLPNKAIHLFNAAFRDMAYEPKEIQLEVLDMILRCMLRAGYPKEAEELYCSMEPVYGDMEEYRSKRWLD